MKKNYGERAGQRSRILDTLGLAAKCYLLATLHRAENTDDSERMRNILDGFADSPQPIVWPLHPITRKRLADFGLAVPYSMRVIDPMGYLDMMMLEKHAALIATDSGGVQKEAYFHQVPCITLREETEWVELVAGGVNRLVGVDTKSINHAVCQIYPFPKVALHLYGYGTSSKAAVILLYDSRYWA